MCGVTKGPPKRKIPWWWNDGVGKAVKEKGNSLSIVEEGKTGTGQKAREDELKVSYCQIKSETRKVIYRAQSENAKILGDMLEEVNEKGNVFKVAKRMVKDNKDVVGCGVVKDRNGCLVVESVRVRDVWSQYYEKLLNEEFDWRRDKLDKVEPVSEIK